MTDVTQIVLLEQGISGQKSDPNDEKQVFHDSVLGVEPRFLDGP
jgi:hypothetical protein